jgi:uncharacterized protein
MKYAAIVQYTPDSATIAQARPAHRQYLSGLKEQGKLVISGPFAGDAGGLLVYEAQDAAQVEKLITDDPFAKQGVFLSWQVREWNVIFVNESLLCGKTFS